MHTSHSHAFDHVLVKGMGDADSAMHQQGTLQINMLQAGVISEVDWFIYMSI